jgi:hypothetical protein
VWRWLYLESPASGSSWLPFPTRQVSLAKRSRPSVGRPTLEGARSGEAGLQAIGGSMDAGNVSPGPGKTTVSPIGIRRLGAPRPQCSGSVHGDTAPEPPPVVPAERRRNPLYHKWLQNP